ncbi:unnamed protein product [Merluccius merluccius]
MLRERRAKKNVCTLLEDLREKNLINEELKERLDFYSGAWNNNPTAGQFQGIFRRLMVRCGVSPSGLGNMAAQDDTVSLSAVEMSAEKSAEMALMLTGNIPVAWNPDWAFSTVAVFFQASVKKKNLSLDSFIPQDSLFHLRPTSDHLC